MSAEVEVALLPCPFCGGEPSEFTERDQRIEPLVRGHPIDVFIDNTYFGVRCDKCDITMSNPFIEREYAIAAWNTRATTPKDEAISELVGAIVDLIDGFPLPTTASEYELVQSGCDPDKARTIANAAALIAKHSQVKP